MKHSLTKSEAEIQAQIIKEMRSRGWLVNKLIQTTLNGSPDLIAHKDGRTVYIEVKRPGQKVRPLQDFRHRELAKYGIFTYVLVDISQISMIESK
jgi:Holliday junction resolvase